MRIYFALILLLLFSQGCGPHGSSGTSTSIPKIGGGEPNPSHEQQQQQQEQHQQQHDDDFPHENRCREDDSEHLDQLGPDSSSFILKASLSVTITVVVDHNGKIVDTILGPKNLKEIITVINPEQTQILFDTSNFATPSPLPNHIFAIGSILILDLLDNNLDVCPVDAHCGQGLLRAYLAPPVETGRCIPRLLVRRPDTFEVVPVSAGASHATRLKLIDFSSTDHVAWLSSFYSSMIPEYAFSLDLRDATEGFHELNLVIEYGLLP